MQNILEYKYLYMCQRHTIVYPSCLCGVWGCVYHIPVLCVCAFRDGSADLNPTTLSYICDHVLWMSTAGWVYSTLVWAPEKLRYSSCGHLVPFDTEKELSNCSWNRVQTQLCQVGQLKGKREFLERGRGRKC